MNGNFVSEVIFAIYESDALNSDYVKDRSYNPSNPHNFGFRVSLRCKSNPTVSKQNIETTRRNFKCFLTEAYSGNWVLTATNPH